MLFIMVHYQFPLPSTQDETSKHVALNGAKNISFIYLFVAKEEINAQNREFTHKSSSPKMINKLLNPFKALTDRELVVVIFQSKREL